MLVEIGFGYFTNSMALLSDGWYMASHVFAIELHGLLICIAEIIEQIQSLKMALIKFFPYQDTQVDFVTANSRLDGY